MSIRDSWQIQKINLHYLPSSIFKRENIEINSLGSIIKNGGIKLEINNNIENVYGGVNTTESGNIYTNTNIGQQKVENLNDMIREIKNMLLDTKEISEETLEETNDDLDSISEQLASPEPKISRIKSGAKRIGDFLKKAPLAFNVANELIEKGNVFLENLSEFVNNLTLSM